MHFLLIPFGILSIGFATFFANRQQVSARRIAWLIGILTMVLWIIAFASRPIDGDTYRYYQYFLDINQVGLGSALSWFGPEKFFTTTLWIIGKITFHDKILFGIIALIYIGIFGFSLSKYLNPFNATTLFMCYAAYPFFVAYGSNAIRQGLALAFLLMAYVRLAKGEKQGWVWLLLAPLWHTGSWLAVGVTILHAAMCKFVKSENARWAIVFSALLLTLVISITSADKAILSELAQSIDIDSKQNLYFDDTVSTDYSTGFRIDFFLFSILPLASAFLLRRISPTFSYENSGWWLSLYIGLNCIYNIFSFAPFSDRFGAFSWFLSPLIVYVQILESNRPSLLTNFVGATLVINLILLQTYTGQMIMLR